MANLTDADKVLRNDTGKSIVSKLDGIKDAIVAQGGGAHSLDQLSDVDIDSQTLAAGQSIVYNDVTEKFENGEVSTVAALDDLTDVSISSPAAGDSLRNDGNGNWVNEPTTVAMTQDDWDDIQDKASWRNAHKNTHLVLTDAPNLNATSEDLSYDGGATSTHDVIEGKQDKINEGYDITGLSTPAGITRQNGGYCKIGNLVIVNVRLNLTNNVASETDIISGFPLPVGSNNMVAVAINKDAYAVMTTSGAIRVVGNSLTSGVCVLSTAYMTSTT